MTNGCQGLEFPHVGLLSPSLDGGPVNIFMSQISNISTVDDSGKANFTWVDFSGTSDKMQSLGAIFVQPLTTAQPKPPNVYACTLDAHWRSLHAWIDPSVDSIVHEALPDAVSFVLNTDLLDLRDLRKVRHMRIESGWSNSLNVVYNANGSNQLMMEIISTYYAKSSISLAGNDPAPISYYMAHYLQSALALYVADGLSRLRNPLPTYLVQKMAVERTFNDTPLHSIRLCP
jgi:hypothetical protein